MHNPGAMPEPAPCPVPRLLSVNVGAARLLRVGGRTVLSGIRKSPVDGPVAVGALGLAGDEQADLNVHGGLQKAVYAYPSEHLPYWQAARRAGGASYLAVEVPGDLRAGSALRLMPGPRRLSVAEAIRGKWARHRNG